LIVEILSAVSLLLQLTNAASGLIANAQAIGAMIQKAKDEGRSTFTPEEWAQIKALDDQARNNLQSAIAAAGG
jgi:hypothetical protein